MAHVCSFIKDLITPKRISGNRFWSNKMGKFQKKKKEREKRSDTEGEKKGERKLQEVVESKRRNITSFIERCIARKQVIIYISLKSITISKLYNRIVV